MFDLQSARRLHHMEGSGYITVHIGSRVLKGITDPALTREMNDDVGLMSIDRRIEPVAVFQDGLKRKKH